MNEWQMMIEVQLMAAVVAAACALPGVFLVLRRMAMLSDAISHTVLLGIVLGFFLTRNLSSPFLVLAATLSGVLTVSLVELLIRTGRVREDAAIGLVFPVLFSIGVILVSLYASDLHLDADAALLGELAQLPSRDRLKLWGYDWGPEALYVMAGILLVNALFILLFYKELKLATFDPGLAAALGFSPALIHYGLITLVSVTAVGAFDAVGSVLVVAFMIGPAATAYLLTERLAHMLFLSAGIGAGAAVGGYWLSHALDVNIAGAMAVTTGGIFGAAWLFAPKRGLIAALRRRARQRWEFAQTMLTIHLFNHEGLPEAAEENRVERLHAHLRWKPAFTAQVVGRALRAGLVFCREGQLCLTDPGRQRAGQTIAS